jgi:hypothetical protein
MLFREIIAICSENQQNAEFLNVKVSVENSYHKMSIGSQKLKT